MMPATHTASLSSTEKQSSKQNDVRISCLRFSQSVVEHMSSITTATPTA